MKLYTSLWPSISHYNSALAKGVKSTVWIWNLYLLSHDFEIHTAKLTIISKVFSSNLGYLSIILLWLGGIYFYSIYYFNYNSWLLSPKIILSSAHIVWSIIN